MSVNERLSQKPDANDVMMCIEFIERKIRNLANVDAKFATGPDFNVTSNAIYCRLYDFTVNQGLHIDAILEIWLTNRINGYLHLCKQICEGHTHYSSP